MDQIRRQCLFLLLNLMFLSYFFRRRWRWYSKRVIGSSIGHIENATGGEAEAHREGKAENDGTMERGKNETRTTGLLVGSWKGNERRPRKN